MLQGGVPDIKKTTKMILRDYVNGKLVYAHLRPGFDNNSQS